MAQMRRNLWIIEILSLLVTSTSKSSHALDPGYHGPKTAMAPPQEWKSRREMQKDGNSGMQHIQGLADTMNMISGLDAKNHNNEHLEPMCKEGQVAVPHLGHHKRLSANGCGPQGFQIKEEFGLHKCCNMHDLCFSTCGTTHQFCELEFRHCLEKACKKPLKGTEAQCMQQVTAFTHMTRSFGEGFHASSQRDSCTCMPEEIAGDMHHQFLLDFLEEHEPEAASIEGAEELLKKWEGHEGKLYAGLIKKHGHKFVNFKGIAAELPKFKKKPHHTLEHTLEL